MEITIEKEILSTLIPHAEDISIINEYVSIDKHPVEALLAAKSLSMGRIRANLGQNSQLWAGSSPNLSIIGLIEQFKKTRPPILNIVKKIDTIIGPTIANEAFSIYIINCFLEIKAKGEQGPHYHELEFE
jgi:hypothetical protein